jgi:hypothetical protein
MSKDGIRPLTPEEHRVLAWGKRKGKDWVKLNHPQIYKELVKRCLLRVDK